MKKFYFVPMLWVFFVLVSCGSSGSDPTPPPATHTVSYSGNGNTAGAPPADGNKYSSGQSVTVLGNTGGMSIGGFTFAGWNTAPNGSGTDYSGGSTLVMGPSDVALYAKWTNLPTYNVTYNGNGNTGGTAPTDPNNYLAGATVTVLGNPGGLTRAGFAFNGWNTAANGSGASYAVGATFTMGSTNVTLYAMWTPAYSVTYSANGASSGSVPADGNAYVSGATVTVLGNTGGLARTGYIFDGWNTAANGSGTNYAAGATFTMGSTNVTLYAKWTATYAVSYDANGASAGSVPVDGNRYTAGATVTVLGNTGGLRKINVGGASYRFAGWNTQADGNGTDYGATFTMGSSNVTLYAKWVAYVVRDLGPNGGYIFYDKGAYSNGWRYMEAAPSDYYITKKWDTGSVHFSVTGTSSAIGTGSSNTDKNCDKLSGDTAAWTCRSLGSVYFLPSADELSLMYTELRSHALGGFTNNNYWSSTQNDSDTDEAYCISFNDGNSFTQDKSGSLYIRAATVW